jgi:glycosyltransferase involved in cell wall biosynthesis
MLYPELSRHVARLDQKRKIDLIHAHSALPCGQPAAMIARRLQVPLVVTTHGLDVFSRRREQGLLRLWCDRVSRFVYKRASLNICVSRAVKREMEKPLGNSVRATILYNGVDTELFIPPDEAIDKPSANVLSVGRLDVRKGQDIVLRAVARLAREHPALRYEIVGDGREREKLAALAGELGISERVFFFGRMTREEVAEKMKQCDVFALPSSDEALGCVYLEAMATAKPVIACRRQGIEEIIRHGEDGWLIEPDDVDETEAALRTLLDNHSMRESFGLKARKRIVEEFTLAHQAEQLNAAYRQCLERTG